MADYEANGGWREGMIGARERERDLFITDHSIQIKYSSCRKLDLFKLKPTSFHHCVSTQ